MIVYGRRRVGKTELIKRFCAGKDHIYFLADRRGTVLNAERFASIAAEHFGDVPPKVKNFDDVFAYIAKRVGEKERTIVVVDEFSFLAERDDQIPSVFQLAWDEILNGRNVMLILCGSLVSMMEMKTLSSKSPLYGRRTGQWKVGPLVCEQVKLFFPNYKAEQLMGAYSVLGGVPFYLNEFNDEEDVITNVEKKILTKGEPLYEEAEFLLREELRDYSSYLSILEAIAGGSTRVNEIANFSKIEAKDLPKYLNVLMRLGLVGKERPVTEGKKSKRTMYELKDNYFKFWFRFVFPNKSDIELGEVKKVLEKINADFNSFVGKAFEGVVGGYLAGLNARGLLPFKCTRMGRWWHKGEEIDLVGVDEKTGKILFVECEWRDLTTRRAEAILARLKEKAAAVNWLGGRRSEFYGVIAKEIESKEKLREGGFLVHDLQDIATFSP